MFYAPLWTLPVPPFTEFLAVQEKEEEERRGMKEYEYMRVWMKWMEEDQRGKKRRGMKEYECMRCMGLYESMNEMNERGKKEGNE